LVSQLCKEKVMPARPKDEEAVFYAALELKSQAERTGYLREACKDNQRLFDRVQALLDASGVHHDFLDDPEHSSDVVFDGSPLQEGPGTVIGRYKLLEPSKRSPSAVRWPSRSSSWAWTRGRSSPASRQNVKPWL
jgi:hypothetical protein